MSESKELGVKGENVAVRHLEKAGYKILDRNWRYGHTEIDIIAENNDFVIFVEVKTRTSGFKMSPAAAVNVSKQRTIIFAADVYVQRKNIDKECRFDIISVIKKEDGFLVDHIENAFYPTLR